MGYAQTYTLPLEGTAIKEILRSARTEDIENILRLFEDEVRAGRMLPRLPNEIRAHLHNWLVLEREGNLIGCVSLVFFNSQLCEIRSLAVAPGLRGKGFGPQLVRGALALAAESGARRVITLTRSVAFFERLGFRYSQLAHYPEKVWRDCRPCPLRHRCDETALIYRLDGKSK
jgi:N-acetylglutamate synthase-like GNAT family acetyltransferase